MHLVVPQHEKSSLTWDRTSSLLASGLPISGPWGNSRRVFIGKVWDAGFKAHDFLLIVCGFQESCAQPEVSILTWRLSSCRETQRYIVDLALLFHCCFLTAFPLFLHSLSLLISNCLNLLFSSQGRSRRVKPFSYKWEKRTQKGFCTWKGHTGSCLASSPSSLLSLQLCLPGFYCCVVFYWYYSHLDEYFHFSALWMTAMIFNGHMYSFFYW